MQGAFTPRTISVGTNELFLTDEDFLNGYQAGHLAYMAKHNVLGFTDTSLRKLLMAMLEDMQHPEAYCVGYVVGWIVTFASKEPHERAAAPV